MPAQRAIEIIDAAPERGPLKNPVEYANALPDDAVALKHLLRSEEIGALSKTYVAADRLAVRAQRWFKGIAWSAATAGFLAAALGGLLFYLSVLSIGRALEDAIWTLQYACLAVALLGSFALGRGKPSVTWREQRAKAEAARRGLYARIVAPAPTEGGVDRFLLSLQLECFRRHLLEHQRTWFTERAGQDQKVASIWTAARIASTILIGMAAAPMLAYLAMVPGLPVWVHEILEAVPLKGDVTRRTFWLLGLLGGYLQGFVTLASLISPAERNAKKYAAMATVLTSYVKHLPEVRAQAAQGDQARVTTYANVILEDLTMEASDWEAWHPLRLEMARQLLAQPRVAPPAVGGAA